MNENKHTPEPWRVEIGEQPENIAVLCTSGLAHFEIVSDSQLGDIHADARRITACVNACAGISQQYLEELNGETLADKQMVLITQRDEYSLLAYRRQNILDEVIKQRDELLAALERFMDSHEECTDFDGFTAQIVSMDDYHQAQEAIARVKGEQ